MTIRSPKTCRLRGGDRGRLAGAVCARHRHRAGRSRSACATGCPGQRTPIVPSSPPRSKPDAGRATHHDRQRPRPVPRRERVERRERSRRAVDQRVAGPGRRRRRTGSATCSSRPFRGRSARSRRVAGTCPDAVDRVGRQRDDPAPRRTAASTAVSSVPVIHHVITAVRSLPMRSGCIVAVARRPPGQPIAPHRARLGAPISTTRDPPGAVPLGTGDDLLDRLGADRPGDERAVRIPLADHRRRRSHSSSDRYGGLETIERAPTFGAGPSGAYQSPAQRSDHLAARGERAHGSLRRARARSVERSTPTTARFGRSATSAQRDRSRTDAEVECEPTSSRPVPAAKPRVAAHVADDASRSPAAG